MSSLSPLVDFFFPPLCVHCHREGAWFCSEAIVQLEHSTIRDQPIVAGCDEIIVRFDYDTPTVQALIRSLKYQFWTGLDSSLDICFQNFDHRLRHLPADTIIVPVPLHHSRLRERGFNQSDLIAQSIHRLCKWKMRKFITRTRATKQQAQLLGQARQQNVRDAFRISGSVPQTVLLVDDVITTGATISACATELRRHGAERVIAFALAKG